MRFSKYLSSSNLNKLNESVNFKVGDLATYKDSWGETVGLLIVGELTSGYVATTGSMIGIYTPRNVSKFKIDNLNTCVYIDSNGKVNGKSPVSVFKGTFDQFLGMLDGYDEDDEDENY